MNVWWIILGLAVIYGAVLAWDYRRIVLPVAVLLLGVAAFWVALAGSGMSATTVLGGAALSALIAHLLVAKGAN